MAAFVVDRVFIFEGSGREGLSGKEGGLSGLRPFVDFGVVGPDSGGGIKFGRGLVEDVVAEA